VGFLHGRLQQNQMQAWLRNITSLLSQTYKKWQEHDSATLGAGLAYYAVLSLAPLLVIAVAIAGIAFSKETVQNDIIGQVTVLMGRDGAEAFRAMLKSAQSPKAGVIASVTSIILLLFGASGVFAQLRKALDRMWEIEEAPVSSFWKSAVKEQILSFGMVVAVGFLLLVSLLATTMIAALGKFVTSYVPAAWIQGLNMVISLTGIALLFAVIYRFVPQQRLPWRRLWPGSLVTAILFTIGKDLIGLYLSKAGVGSAYGAAGSLVVLLVWIYYSSQLFLFGAEFTRIYACQKTGSSNIPSDSPNPVVCKDDAAKPLAPSRA